MSTGTPIAEATGLAAPAGTPALIQEPGTLAAFWRRLRARPSAPSQVSSSSACWC